MKCPDCYTRIPNENLNIAADIAQCPSCDLVFKISDNIPRRARQEAKAKMEIDENFDISQPPNGAWINQGEGELIVGATTRSFMALFMVPFMLIWSGGSLGGIYGSQIMNGEFNLFMSLFGIPFLLGSILFWGITLMFITGKVEITLDQREGKVFTGVGKIGYTKRFDLDDITTVREKITTGNKERTGTAIALEGQKQITFGGFLSESRRYYLLKTLQKVLADKADGKSFLRPNLMRHLIKRS